MSRGFLSTFCCPQRWCLCVSPNKWSSSLLYRRFRLQKTGDCLAQVRVPRQHIHCHAAFIFPGTELPQFPSEKDMVPKHPSAAMVLARAPTTPGMASSCRQHNTAPCSAGDHCTCLQHRPGYGFKLPPNATQTVLTDQSYISLYTVTPPPVFSSWDSQLIWPLNSSTVDPSTPLSIVNINLK